MMKLEGKLIDLHVHLDGSLSEDNVRNLAKMQNIAIDGDLTKKLRVSDNCADLNEYLEKFDFPLQLLQTKEALTESIYTLLKEQSAQRLIYTEIRFAPQLHTRKGLSRRQVIEAAIQGKIAAERKTGIKAGLILCCMRGDGNMPDNEETVGLAAQFLGEGVVAVDLAGAEGLFATDGYKELFAKARNMQVPFTIHAGEAAGSESIEAALECGTKRLGHGIMAAWDKPLMEKLARENVFLELCPTSNLNTKVAESIDKYPIMELINAGVRVTINTDNMTVSDTTLKREIELVAEAFKLTDGQIRNILLNSAEAAFAPREVKEYLKGCIMSGD